METEPPKKYGRGRPRKGEIRPSKPLIKNSSKKKKTRENEDFLVSTPSLFTSLWTPQNLFHQNQEPEPLYSSKLEDNDLEEFLPQKKESLPFFWGKDTSPFILKRFESIIHSNKGGEKKRKRAETDRERKGTGASIFLGGSLSVFRWFPDCVDGHHFLAVGCDKEIEENIKISNSRFSGSNSIQLWDFHLDTVFEERLKTIQLVLIMKLSFGTVFDIQWCPRSYSNSSSVSHLGVLTASFSDGFVRFFSIPLPSAYKDHVEATTEGKNLAYPLFIDPKPLLVLDVESPVKTLQWSIVDPILLGGCYNGKVALWSLTASHSADGDPLKPFLQFKAHDGVGPVTSVSWSPLNKFIFLTTSFEGECSLWDLRNPFKPLYIVPFFRGISSCWGAYQSTAPNQSMPIIGSSIDGSLRILNYLIPKSNIFKDSDTNNVVWSVTTRVGTQELIMSDAEGNIYQLNIELANKKAEREQQECHLVEVKFSNSTISLDFPYEKKTIIGCKSEKKEFSNPLVGIHQVEFCPTAEGSHWIAFSGKTGLLHFLWVPNLTSKKKQKN